MSLSDEQINLIRENVDSKIKFWSDDKIRSFQEESFISETKFVAFVLSSGLTQAEVADLMGYDDSGVVSRYIFEVRNRIERAERTVEVGELDVD